MWNQLQYIFLYHTCEQSSSEPPSSGKQYQLPPFAIPDAKSSGQSFLLQDHEVCVILFMDPWLEVNYCELYRGVYRLAISHWMQPPDQIYPLYGPPQRGSHS